MILLDRNRISRTLNRMAFQIMEASGEEPICLIGLNVRGMAIAELLMKFIQENRTHSVDLYHINAGNNEPFNFEKRPSQKSILVVVDDVIFSGLTMYNALTKIPGLADFEKTCVAALVDRGHRRLPIQAEIVGVDIPTKLNEHIELVLENDLPEKIVLINQ